MRMKTSAQLAQAIKSKMVRASMKGVVVSAETKKLKKELDASNKRAKVLLRAIRTVLKMKRIERMLP